MTEHPGADGAQPGDTFTTWLAASCRRQGVPLTIRDPGLITQVATLLGAPSKRRTTTPGPSTTSMPRAAQGAEEPDVAEWGLRVGDGTHSSDHDRTVSRAVVPRAA